MKTAIPNITALVLLGAVTACFQDLPKVEEIQPHQGIEGETIDPVPVETYGSIDTVEVTPVTEEVVVTETPGITHVDEGDVDHLAIARGKLAASLPEEAIDELEKAIFDDPDSFEAHVLLGQALRDNGQPEAAIWSLEQATVMQPEDFDVLRTLTTLKLEVSDGESAEKSARALLKLDPTSAEGYRLLARAYSKRAMWTECIEANQEAISLGDSSPFTYNNMGYAELVLGQYEDAIESFDNAVAMEGATHIMWNNLGIALEKNDRLIESHTAYQKALELNGKYVNAKVNLKRLTVVADSRGIILGGDVVAGVDAPEVPEKEVDSGSDPE